MNKQGNFNFSNFKPARQRQWFTFKFTDEDVALVPSRLQLVNLMKCCFKCKLMPPTESLVCKNGHIICFSCMDRQCHGFCEFTHKKTREFCEQPFHILSCYLYTSLLNACIIKCPVPECSKKFPGEEIAQHQYACERLENLHCPSTDCSDTPLFSLQSLVRHIQSFHEVNITATIGSIRLPIVSSIFVEFTNETSPRVKIPFLIQFEDIFFILVCTTNTVNGIKSIVTVLYSMEENQQSKYHEKELLRGSIVLHGNNNFRWMGPPPFIRNPLSNVIKTEMCLTVPVSGFENVHSFDVHFFYVPENEPNRLPIFSWRPAILPQSTDTKSEDGDRAIANQQNT